MGFADDFKAKASELLEDAKDALGDAKDKAADVFDDAKDKAGDAFEVRVVEGDEMAVRRDVDVGLEVVVAEVDGVAEGANGVLDAEVGGQKRAATVSHGSEAGGQVVRVNLRHED